MCGWRKDLKRAVGNSRRRARVSSCRLLDREGHVKETVKKEEPYRPLNLKMRQLPAWAN